MISELHKVEAEESSRERLLAASFTAYQLGAGGTGPETFGEYLARLGLNPSDAAEAEPKPEAAEAQVARLRSMGIEVTMAGE